MRKICISSRWNFGNEFRVVSLLLRYDNYHQFSQIFIKVFIRSSRFSILPNKLQKPYLENMVIFMLLIMGHTDCPNTGIPTLILRNFMRAIITSACQVLSYAEEYYNEPTKVLHSILDWITIIYYMYLHNSDTLFLVESCFDSEPIVKERNMTNRNIGTSHPPGWGNKCFDDEQLKWYIWDALGCYICFCSSVDMYSFHLIARVSFQQVNLLLSTSWLNSK